MKNVCKNLIVEKYKQFEPIYFQLKIKKLKKIIFLTGKIIFFCVFLTNIYFAEFLNIFLYVD